MARISLKCSCGWSFSISESTQGHEVTCSSCNGPVPIPGREVGAEVLSPGELAARKLQQARTTKLLIGLVAGVVVIGLLLVWQFSGGEEPPPQRYTQKPAPPSRTYLPAPPPSSSGGSRVGNPGGNTAEPEAPKVDVVFLTREIDKRIWHSNMRGIVAEVLRLKGQLAARDRVLSDMAADETQIAILLKKITEVGATPEIQGRMMRGDRILSLNDIRVDGIAVRTGRAVLEKWLQTFTPPTDPIKVVVSRAGNTHSLYIRFPSQTTELLTVARLPGTLPEDIAAMPRESTPPPAPPQDFLLNAGVVEDVTARLAVLSPGYLRLLSAGDRMRLERLLKEGKGSVLDNQFLANFQASALPRFEADAGAIATKLDTTRPDALKKSEQVDVVVFKDGRTKTGKVVKKTPTHVTIEFTFGKNKASVPYPLSDIREIKAGAGSANEFPDKYEKAGGAVRALESLLSWCEQENLKFQAEVVALSILEKDPAHPVARKRSGIRTPSGLLGGTAGRSPQVGRPPVVPRPVPPVPDPSSGGAIAYEGRNWVPRDLKRHFLEAKKYALIDGRWYRGEKRSFELPGLLKKRGHPAISVAPTTASLVDDYEGTFTPRSAGGYYPVRDSAPTGLTKLRFYAPRVGPNPPSRKYGTAAGQPVSGEVHVSVRLDAPLIEATVKLLVEAKGSGFITVDVGGRNGRTRLRKISGDDYVSIEVPSEVVQGVMQFDLYAGINFLATYDPKAGAANAREVVPRYEAKLFPSKTRTFEVFKLSAVVGKPLDHIDKLFAPFPGVLR